MLIEGTYASYKLSKESAKKLEDWMKESEIVEPVPIEDLHVTTTYSTNNVDIIPSEKTIVLKKEDYSITTYGRALVLAVKSDELQKIHAAALEAGANYSYESYKPHITISYNAEANDNILPLLMNPTFDITLSHEVVEPLTEEQERMISEYFEMAEHYKFWGWIKPSGALLLPTLEMKNSEDIQFNHENLIRNFKPELGNYDDNYDDAYNIGMIRFLIDNNNKLYFDVPSICKPSTIRIGYSNIENYIMKNPDKLKNIFNSKISRIQDFNYSIMKKIKKSWEYGYYGTDSVNSLIDRIRNQNLEDKIKEETPANSTVNIAGYDKPLKTFKMFRRKPINLN